MSIRLGTNIIAGRSPYQPSLFDFKWSDHILNDPQWIRADSNNWHHSIAYKPAYDHLVADIEGKEVQSETIEGIIITYYLANDGHKICMPDQAEYIDQLYNKTGSAWYYILDTTAACFKVPRTKAGIVGVRNAVGEYVKFGLPKSEYCIAGMQPAANQMYLYFYAGNFNHDVLENTAAINIEAFEEATTSAVEAISSAMSDLDTMINAQYHPNIFENKWSDSILNDIQWLRSNTFSWQSGQVYETAYNHLVEDIKNKTLKYKYTPNVEKFGSVEITEDGILKGFASTTSYGVINNVYTPTTAFEIAAKVHTPNTYADTQSIFGCPVGDYHGMLFRITSATNISVWLSSNGSSWNIMNGKAHTCNIPANTDVWVKLTWDGTTYDVLTSIDGVNYTSLGTTASTGALYLNDNKIMLGGYNWADRAFTGGMIDLKESYVKIDDSLVWKGVDTLSYYEADDKHKICLPDQEERINKIYNSTGTAWYYILDQENTRFKLPRKRSTQIVESVENIDGTWYKLYADGWIEQGGKITYGSTTADIVVSLPVKMESTTYQTSITLFGDTGAYTNAPTGNYFTIWNRTTTSFTTHRYNAQTVQQMWQVCGQSALDMSKYQANEKYLYFYVGKFLQTAVINTAALNTELFNNKVDIGHQVIDFQAPTAENGYTWYRLYADGWLEQGGYYVFGASRSGTAQVINLPIPFDSTIYNISLQIKSSGHSFQNGSGPVVLTNTTNTISVQMNDEGSSILDGFYWQVSGMAA